MSLHTWLNDRHHKKSAERLTKRLDEPAVFHHFSWEEIASRWDALEAKQNAQPWFMKAARRMRIYLFGFHGLLTVRVNPRNIINNTVWSRQRVKRGWADSDTWSLDGYIARVLSGMLARLAEQNHSYPARPPFETPELWDAHLRDLSARLRRSEDDSEEGFEVTREAMKEFAENFGEYWD
jgi:hypothetical protein